MHVITAVMIIVCTINVCARDHSFMFLSNVWFFVHQNDCVFPFPQLYEKLNALYLCAKLLASRVDEAR